MDRNAIREIITTEINNYITEIPDHFSIIEYTSFKQSFINNANIEFLFYELDSYVIIDDKVKREKLINTLTDIFGDNLAHYNQQVKENGSLTKALEDYKRKLKRLDEKFTSEGIRDNSVLHVDIVMLDLVCRMNTERARYKIKFMFENGLFESRRFEGRERNIQKFIFKVNSPVSELYVQLIGYNAIGSGMIKLKELEDQKKSIKLIKLLNDEGEIVANLHLQMLWVHSFTALYSQRIAQITKDLDEGKQKEKKFSQKLESICSIIPGLRGQLAQDHFGTYRSLRTFKFIRPQKSQYISIALMTVIFALIVSNLTLAMCFPNIAELCLVFILAIIIYNESLADNTWMVHIVCAILIVKDIIVFFFYTNIDYTVMLSNVDNERIMVKVAKIVIWVNIGIKIALMTLYGAYSNHQ